MGVAVSGGLLVVVLPVDCCRALVGLFGGLFGD